jgi:hypothetical protein
MVIQAVLAGLLAVPFLFRTHMGRVAQHIRRRLQPRAKVDTED